jgi:hypothetical protein
VFAAMAGAARKETARHGLCCAESRKDEFERVLAHGRLPAQKRCESLSFCNTESIFVMYIYAIYLLKAREPHVERRPPGRVDHTSPRKAPSHIPQDFESLRRAQKAPARWVPSEDATSRRGIVSGADESLARGAPKA